MVQLSLNVKMENGEPGSTMNVTTEHLEIIPSPFGVSHPLLIPLTAATGSCTGSGAAGHSKQQG